MSHKKKKLARLGSNHSVSDITVNYIFSVTTAKKYKHRVFMASG